MSLLEIGALPIVSGKDASGEVASRPELDGLGTVSPFHCVPVGDGCSLSQSFSTTRGHDIVVVIVETFGQTRSLSVLDSTGLSFKLRLSHSGSYGLKLWEFYARTTSRLKLDNVTVITDNCCYTVIGLQVLAVSGANSPVVFDQNPSVPAQVTCPGHGCGPGDCYAFDGLNPGTCSATIQTSGIDFVIAGIAINEAPACGGYVAPSYHPPGFNRLTVQNSRFEVDYTITSDPPSTTVFDCNGTDAAAIVLDAFASHSMG